MSSLRPLTRRIRTCMLAALLMAVVWLTPTVVAAVHPGHGSKVVLGTLKEVTRDAIVVETLDAATGAVTRVRVLLEEGARFRIDKERIQSLDGMLGQRAIVSVDWEDDEQGGQKLTATEVRFTRPKKK